jgi:hypothetical protein
MHASSSNAFIHQLAHDRVLERAATTTTEHHQTVIVVGNQIIGNSMPPDILRGCQRLAAVTQTALLGIEFIARSVKEWIFAGATPLPDLRRGGKPLLEVLAEILHNG